jgi:hypothetical protein
LGKLGEIVAARESGAAGGTEPGGACRVREMEEEIRRLRMEK